MKNHATSTDKKSRSSISSFFSLLARVFGYTLGGALLLFAILYMSGKLPGQDAGEVQVPAVAASGSQGLEAESEETAGSQPEPFDPVAFVDAFLREHEGQIARAERADEASVRRAAGELDDFFSEKRKLIPELVEDILSFGNKTKVLWYLVEDKVNDTHKTEAFLEELISARLGGKEVFRASEERAIAGLKHDLEESHNELMVELETALAVEEHFLHFRLVDGEFLRQEFQAHFDEQIRKALTVSVVTLISTELIVLAVERFVTTAAIGVAAFNAGALACSFVSSLALQASAFTAGVASAPSTLGLGLVAGIAIAIVVDQVADSITSESIEKDLNQAFGEWRGSTLAGFRKSTGEGLEKFHETRRIALREALLTTVAELGK